MFASKIGTYVVAALVASAVVVLVAAGAYWRGHSNGYDKYAAEQAAASQKVEIRRKGEDARLKTLSDYNLCVDGLRRNGMPINACEQLRGLQEEQSEPGGDGGAD